ncbi:hypothetical protein YC2023_072252 [Brassica napus]
MFFSFILISPIPLQAYCFSHLSYLSPRLSHLSHLSPTASPPRLTTTRVTLSPPLPRSPSHHHHGRPPTTTTVDLSLSLYLFVSVYLLSVSVGSLVAAGGGKAHGCWKRGKVMEEAAAVFSFFLGLDLV